MINILLNGCNGKMGKSFCNYIENSSEFNLLYGIDKDTCCLFNDITKKPDVIIDFSTVSSTFMSLDYAVENLVPIVIATTGFSKKDEKKIYEYSQAIPIFKSSNLSYGIKVFSDVASTLAQKLSNVDISIIEKHHKYKKDSPSRNSTYVS